MTLIPSSKKIHFYYATGILIMIAMAQTRIQIAAFGSWVSWFGDSFVEILR